MVTYNHASYIKEAIKSILSQDVNFNVEVIISDDHSNDNTQSILEPFVGVHGGFTVKYKRHESNVGMMKNIHDLVSSAAGTYVAFCEGDDYWVDSQKLQRQVDFLESNIGYHGICANSSLERDGQIKYNYQEMKRHWLGREFDRTISFYDIASHNFPHTSTWLYRNDFELPLEFINYVVGDVPLFLLIADKGEIMYENVIVSVYRKHSGGVTNELDKSSRIEHVGRLIDILNSLQVILTRNWTRSISDAIIELYCVALRDYPSLANFLEAQSRINNSPLILRQFRNLPKMIANLLLGYFRNGKKRIRNMINL